MAGPLTDYDWLRPASNRNHTRQEAHKHQAPVAPRTPDFANWTRAPTTRSPLFYQLTYLISTKAMGIGRYSR